MPDNEPGMLHVASQMIGARSGRGGNAKSPVEHPGCLNNVEKLRLISQLIGIRASEVARIAGVSQAFISMILSGQREGSPEFWFTMEKRLAHLVEHRRQPVFVNALPLRTAVTQA